MACQVRLRIPVLQGLGGCDVGANESIVRMLCSLVSSALLLLCTSNGQLGGSCVGARSRGATVCIYVFLVEAICPC